MCMILGVEEKVVGSVVILKPSSDLARLWLSDGLTE
jgi:hypothetical protein